MPGPDPLADAPPEVRAALAAGEPFPWEDAPCCVDGIECAHDETPIDPATLDRVREAAEALGAATARVANGEAPYPAVIDGEPHGGKAPVTDERIEPVLYEPDGYVPPETEGGLLVATGARWTIDHRDPDTVRHVAGLVRRRAVEQVDERASRLRRAREALLGDRPASTSDVAEELRELVDTRDALRTLGGALNAAADHADGLLVDVVIDTGKRSARTGDGHGGDLKVTLDTPRETIVDVDAVVGSIRAALALDYDRIEGVCARCKETTHDPECRDGYLAGVDDGIAKLRELLVSSPAWRTTALDAYVRALSGRGGADAHVASALEKAYRRRDKPDAPTRAKVEHVEPAKVRGAAS